MLNIFLDVCEMSIIREPLHIDHEKLHDCNIIGIDGDQGAGKTTLASELCENLEGEVVSVDDYLLKPNGSYLAQVDQQNLVARLNAVAKKPLIIESVLLLEVLARISHSLSFNMDIGQFLAQKPDALPRIG